MKNCRICDKGLADDARFCHHCGASVIVETFDCPECGQENDLHTVACSNCGHVFFDKKKAKTNPPPNNIFKNSFQQSLEQELTDKFSLAFERRLGEEHRTAFFNRYIDRFFKCGFKTSVDFRIQQLAEQFQGITDEKNRNLIAGKAFEELLDYFIIRFCEDLNEVAFPELILKYQGVSNDHVNLGQMVVDYLAFQDEGLTVYTDFITMPAHKLKNAAENFLAPQKGETIYFIADFSIFGTCKDGFSMTRDCIYWKMPLEKKQRVYYKNLEEIKREEDWITINGIFFNANKALNLKLLRLLKKLKWLYGRGGSL